MNIFLTKNFDDIDAHDNEDLRLVDSTNAHQIWKPRDWPITESSDDLDVVSTHPYSQVTSGPHFMGIREDAYAINWGNNFINYKLTPNLKVSL